MSTKENKALIRHMYDLMNRGELDGYYELLSPNYVEHMTSGNMLLEQLKQFETIFGTAFSDISVAIVEMVAEGDKVSVLVTWKMTHTGEYMGIAPTGKKIDMTNANVFKIAKGRIKEGWNVMDMRFLQQLGAIPKQ